MGYPITCSVPSVARLSLNPHLRQPNCSHGTLEQLQESDSEILVSKNINLAFRKHIVLYSGGGWGGQWGTLPIPVASRSNAWVCGLLLAGIVGSNTAGGIDVCLLWVLCVVRLMSLCRADHSSRGFLPSVVCLSVIVNPRYWGALAHWGGGLLRHGKKKWGSLHKFIYEKTALRLAEASACEDTFRISGGSSWHMFRSWNMLFGTYFLITY